MKTPLHIRLKNQRYKKRNRDRLAAYYRLRKSHCTAEQFDAALAAQQNRCGICNEVFIEVPCADHDHDTNTFRGLLCQHCNRGLGHFKDSIIKLKAAIAWLTK